MEIKHGSIIPGKSAYEKIGKGSTHDLNEVVAELIDNSIEAKTDAQKDDAEMLEVNVKVDRMHVIVSDNAKGMTSREAIKSISLFNSTKSGKELGGFGVGMKSASLSIGNILDIKTAQEDSNEEALVRFSIEEWNNDPNLTWERYPYKVEKKALNKHGTTITITDLRINLTDLKIARLRKSIGKRYAAFINSKSIVIKVNEIPCHAETIDWRDRYPKPILINTSFGPITGLLGLTKKSSQRGDFGLNMFRNSRLIMQNQKFGISGHPSHAFIVGDINLDFIPVNQDKNKFKTESKEYEEAEQACKDSELFKEMITASGKAGHAGGTQIGQAKLAKKIPHILDALATIYDRRSRKDELPLDVIEENAANGRTNAKMKVNHATATDKTVPAKQVHRAFKYTTKDGKELKIKHEFIYDENQGRKNYHVDEVGGTISIVTNEAYPPFVRTKDRVMYLCETFADTIAEIHGIEYNLEIEDVFEYQNDLLKDMVRFLYKHRIKDEAE